MSLKDKFKKVHLSGIKKQSREKIYSKVRNGRCSEEEAIWCVLDSIFRSLTLIESEGLDWSLYFKKAKEKKEIAEEYVDILAAGDESPRTFVNIYAGNFAENVNFMIHDYGHTIISSRGISYIIECYLRNTGHEYSRKARTRFLCDKVLTSDQFDIVWNDIVNEDAERSRKDGTPEYAYFKPEKVDILNFFELSDYVADKADEGIMPVNRYGEFIDPETGKALPIGKMIFDHGQENGMPQDNETAEDYPHIDFKGVIEEKQPEDVKRLYNTYNSMNNPDVCDETIRKAVKRVPGMGREDLVMAYEVKR